MAIHTAIASQILAEVEAAFDVKRIEERNAVRACMFGPQTQDKLRMSAVFIRWNTGVSDPVDDSLRCRRTGHCDFHRKERRRCDDNGQGAGVCAEITAIVFALEVSRRFFLQRGWTPLMYAASKGFTDVINVLLQYGAETTVNAVDREGWNALIHAAANGHASAVDVLLRAGASDVRFPFFLAC
jgi:Ankyrin repeats (3 copies)